MPEHIGPISLGLRNWLPSGAEDQCRPPPFMDRAETRQTDSLAGSVSMLRLRRALPGQLTGLLHPDGELSLVELVAPRGTALLCAGRERTQRRTAVPRPTFVLSGR